MVCRSKIFDFQRVIGHWSRSSKAKSVASFRLVRRTPCKQMRLAWATPWHSDVPSGTAKAVPLQSVRGLRKSRTAPPSRRPLARRVGHNSDGAHWGRRWMDCVQNNCNPGGQACRRLWSREIFGEFQNGKNSIRSWSLVVTNSEQNRPF